MRRLFQILSIVLFSYMAFAADPFTGKVLMLDLSQVPSTPVEPDPPEDPPVAQGETYPAPTTYAATATYPGAFEAYLPPVTNTSPLANTPEVAEYTRKASAGDAVAYADSEGTADWVVYANGYTNTVSTTNTTTLAGAFVVPNDAPVDDVILAWPTNANGIGRAIVLNQAEEWWVMPDKVKAGRQINLFGKDLALGGGNAYVYCVEEDEWLTSVEANPFHAVFNVPSGWTDGAKTLKAHNGHGRAYGWSGGSVALEIHSPADWNDTPASWIDVTDAPYLATGLGIADDLAAIDAAIAACGAGGTVYFPAGTYAVSDNVWCGSDKRLLGAGPGSSIITMHSSYSSASDNSIINAGNMYNGQIESLQLLSTTDSPNNNRVLLFNAVEDITVTNCIIDGRARSVTQWGNCGRINGGKNFQFYDCDFYMAGAFNNDGSHTLFKDCNFYGFYNLGSLTYLDHYNAMIDCTGQSFDNSDPFDEYGWCNGRLSVTEGRNMYFGSNTTDDMWPRRGADATPPEIIDENSGEQILTEGKETLWIGLVDSATSNTVACAGLATDYDGRQCAIISGKGRGQHRQITGYSSGTLTVGKNWLVEPDNTSEIAIGDYAMNMAVYNNNLSSDPRAASLDAANYSACAGLSVYGGASSVYAVSNTITDVRQGIIFWSLREGDPDGLWSPDYFGVIHGNSISNSRNGLVADSYTVNADSIPNNDIGLFGLVWRHNSVDGATANGISMDGGGTAISQDMMVWQNNSITNAVTDISINATINTNQMFID